jgi:hypothetical protein
VHRPPGAPELEAALTAHAPEFMGYLARLSGRRPRRVPQGAIREIADAMATKIAGLLAVADELRTARPGARRSLLNAWMHDLDPTLPPDVDVFDYYAQLLTAAIVPFRPAADEYMAFVAFVVRSRGVDAVLDFLQAAFGPGGLEAQMQRMTNDVAIPPVLRRAPRRVTTATVQRRLDAWRPVAADWEQLVRVPYGLLLIAKGESKTWAETGAVALRNRADALAPYPTLAALAPVRWVTIRNALDHGHALYDPVLGAAVFPDTRGREEVPGQLVHDEIVRMLSASMTIVGTTYFALDVLYEPIRRWSSPSAGRVTGTTGRRPTTAT